MVGSHTVLLWALAGMPNFSYPWDSQRDSRTHHTEVVPGLAVARGWVALGRVMQKTFRTALLNVEQSPQH